MTADGVIVFHGVFSGGVGLEKLKLNIGNKTEITV
jgi:hypothetical protein